MPSTRLGFFARVFAALFGGDQSNVIAATTNPSRPSQELNGNPTDDKSVTHNPLFTEDREEPEYLAPTPLPAGATEPEYLAPTPLPAGATEPEYLAPTPLVAQSQELGTDYAASGDHAVYAPSTPNPYSDLLPGHKKEPNEVQYAAVRRIAGKGAGPDVRKRREIEGVSTTESKVDHVLEVPTTRYFAKASHQEAPQSWAIPVSADDAKVPSIMYPALTEKGVQNFIVPVELPAKSKGKATPESDPHYPSATQLDSSRQMSSFRGG